MGYYKFAYHVRQIFLNSDTSVALLSGAPFDDKSWWLLPNEQIREAVDMINRVSGARRMLGHVVITPGQAGWLDEVDKAIDKLRPDSWKAYTIGDPLSVDHAVWGTDPVWYGSPQWQIEALRCLEIPEDMQKKHGFAPLGPANGLVKNQIFGSINPIYTTSTCAPSMSHCHWISSRRSSRSIAWLVRSTSSVTMLLTASLPSVRRKMLAHGDSGWGQVPSA